MLIASTATSASPRARSQTSNASSSARQGAHQVAQKLTMTILPRCAFSENFWPSSCMMRSSGEGLPACSASARAAVLATAIDKTATTQNIQR
jgi:hypothetical protein